MDKSPECLLLQNTMGNGGFSYNIKRPAGTASPGNPPRCPGCLLCVCAVGHERKQELYCREQFVHLLSPRIFGCKAVRARNDQNLFNNFQRLGPPEWKPKPAAGS